MYTWYVYVHMYVYSIYACLFDLMNANQLATVVESEIYLNFPFPFSFYLFLLFLFQLIFILFLEMF